jgi:hypothetical protein
MTTVPNERGAKARRGEWVECGAWAVGRGRRSVVLVRGPWRVSWVCGVWRVACELGWGVGGVYKYSTTYDLTV